VLLWVLCFDNPVLACALTPAEELLRRRADRVAASICDLVWLCIMREYEVIAAIGSDS
jgi:hypothetical protein